MNFDQHLNHETQAYLKSLDREDDEPEEDLDEIGECEDDEPESEIKNETL